MITLRAWKIQWGIDKGRYDFPERTKNSIKKLIDREVALSVNFFVFVVYSLYVLSHLEQVHQTVTIRNIFLTNFMLLLFGVWFFLVRRNRSFEVWKHLLNAMSFLHLHLNTPELLEGFGILGLSDSNLQTTIIENRLRSMASVAKSLRDEVNSKESADLAHNAMEVFINFSDSCLISGLTEKPGNQFFPKGEKNG